VQRAARWPRVLSPCGRSTSGRADTVQAWTRNADRAHLWHPFTQQRGWVEEDPLIVERAEGTDLIDAAGRRYIDGVSSLWCNVHGHCHPPHRRGGARQLDRVAHSTMLASAIGRIELARRLVELAPPGLTRVFYSDSGSTATEVALKMAFQYWRQRGEQRTKFVSLRMAYHGDTIGSCRSRDRPVPLGLRPCCSTRSRRSPATRRAWTRCHAVRRRVAAVIMEPLVQGAQGCWCTPRATWQGSASVPATTRCSSSTMVATGFGRTRSHVRLPSTRRGARPALRREGDHGGYLPLAATLATERIYEGFPALRGVPTFLPRTHRTGQPAGLRGGSVARRVREEHTLERLERKIELLEQLLADRRAPMPEGAPARRS